MRSLLSSILLVLLLVMACSCASVGHRLFPPTSDPAAAEAQREIGEVVLIEQEVVYDLVTKDPGSKSNVIKYRMSPMRRYGTGVVVAVDRARRESLILTAGHVVGVDPPVVPRGVSLMSFKVSALMKVTAADGDGCAATEVTTNVLADVSMIRAMCVVGTPAELADEMPPAGAIIQNVAAPAGQTPDGSFFVFDGRYSGEKTIFRGLLPLRMMAVTTPTIGGQSGSPIYYHGRVVALVNAVNSEFHHMTYCTALDALRDIVRLGRDLAWGGDHRG